MGFMDTSCIAAFILTETDTEENKASLVHTQRVSSRTCTTPSTTGCFYLRNKTLEVI